jgi:hypothetical protein
MPGIDPIDSGAIDNPVRQNRKRVGLILGNRGIVETRRVEHVHERAGWRERLSRGGQGDHGAGNEYRDA